MHLQIHVSAFKNSNWYLSDWVKIYFAQARSAQFSNRCLDPVSLTTPQIRMRRSRCRHQWCQTLNRWWNLYYLFADAGKQIWPFCAFFVSSFFKADPHSTIFLLYYYNNFKNPWNFVIRTNFKSFRNKMLDFWIWENFASPCFWTSTKCYVGNTYCYNTIIIEL